MRKIKDEHRIKTFGQGFALGQPERDSGPFDLRLRARQPLSHRHRFVRNSVFYRLVSKICSRYFMVDLLKLGSGSCPIMPCRFRRADFDTGAVFFCAINASLAVGMNVARQGSVHRDVD